MKSATVSAINAMFSKRLSSVSRLKQNKSEDTTLKIKPIYCADGVSLSVQASRKHRCFPRNDEGPYQTVEVGFPSSPPQSNWAEYCTGDFDKKPCGQVYAYVPIEVVAEFIIWHGGIRLEETPAMIVPPLNLSKTRNPLEQKRYNLTAEDMGLKF